MVCVDELDFGWIGGPVRAAGGLWRDPRCEDLLSDGFETHEHDVLVIGAGGAGLRAAIEALGQGASVGVVSKSLLGKAQKFGPVSEGTAAVFHRFQTAVLAKPEPQSVIDKVAVVQDSMGSSSLTSVPFPSLLE